MKKASLLVLALVALLPGCCCRKNQESVNKPVRRNNVEKYMQTDVAVEEENVDGDEDGSLDEVDFNIDLSDEDYEELLKALKDNVDEDVDGDGLGYIAEEDSDEEDADEEDSEEMAFNWIDSQTDDEFKKLYFSFNHYGIRADQKTALAYDIEQVKQLVAEAGNVQPTIVIEGHACQEGTPSYNLALSEKRAKNVADLFVAAGVDQRLIKVVGRGQECPTVMNGKVVNGSREDRAPNRRVEVRVIYT